MREMKKKETADREGQARDLGTEKNPPPFVLVLFFYFDTTPFFLLIPN